MEVKIIVEYVAHATFQTKDSPRPFTIHYVRARSADKSDTKSIYLIKVIDRPFDYPVGSTLKVMLQKSVTRFPYVSECLVGDISVA